MKNLLFSLIIFFNLNFIHADTNESSVFSDFKKVCRDIGFAPNTDKFNDCVLKLYKQDKDNKEIRRAENEKNFLLKKEQELAEQQLLIDRAAANAQKKQAKEMERERKRKNMENYYKALGIYPHNNTVVVPRQKEWKCVNFGPLGGGYQCRYQ